MGDKVIQRVNEFCSEGKLEEYREELTIIFKKIWENGCRVTTRYDADASSHLFQKDGCLIRVSLIKKYTEPVEIIWTILHEFGHHLSGEIPKTVQDDTTTIVPREREAWELARKEVLLYPKLEGKMGSFDRYAQKLLQGYIDEFGDTTVDQ